RAALRAHALPNTSITEIGDRFRLVGIEGPAAIDVVSAVLDEAVDGLPFQAVRETTWRDARVLVSRTGFTGEFGFTLMIPADIAADRIAEALTHAKPAGIEALFVAMLEVRQPILERELMADDTVISAALNWLVDLEKEDFIGRSAVISEFEQGASTGRLTITSAGCLRRGQRLWLDDIPAGEVVHGAFSPSLSAWCGVARVARQFLASGLAF